MLDFRIFLFFLNTFFIYLFLLFIYVTNIVKHVAVFVSICWLIIFACFAIMNLT